MVEHKKEINDLLKKSGQDLKYFFKHYRIFSLYAQGKNDRKMFEHKDGYRPLLIV